MSSGNESRRANRRTQHLARLKLAQSAGLLGAALALTAPVFAQEAAESAASGPATLQEVVVTGSRIKGNPDVASANPITVIGQTELQNSNSVDIQNVLSKLPSVGTDGLNGAESSNFGGNA